MAGLPRELLRFSVFNIICLLVCFVAEGMGLLVGSIFNVTVFSFFKHNHDDVLCIQQTNHLKVLFRLHSTARFLFWYALYDI